MNTSCNTCLFLSENKHCKKNIIDKIRHMKTINYDEQQSPVIMDYKCLFGISTNILDKTAKDEDKIKLLEFAQTKKQQLSYTIFYVLPVNHTEELLIKDILAIRNIEHSPQQLIISFSHDHTLSNSLISILEDNLLQSNIAWKLNKVVIGDMEDSYRLLSFYNMAKGNSVLYLNNAINFDINHYINFIYDTAFVVQTPFVAIVPDRLSYNKIFIQKQNISKLITNYISETTYRSITQPNLFLELISLIDDQSLILQYNQ